MLAMSTFVHHALFREVEPTPPVPRRRLGDRIRSRTVVLNISENLPDWARFDCGDRQVVAGLPTSGPLTAVTPPPIPNIQPSLAVMCRATSPACGTLRDPVKTAVKPSYP